ncbi:MAG: glycosyltransferase family 39 protein [Acidothermales bacterium]|nr:glycosyltransferase family 39 protein [Acidothermales bacterium]
MSGRYGFHRDEMYFIVAGHHPDAGYVDQPPLTPLLARVSTTVFGTTPVGLRVVATLATMASVLVVALIARELGGGRTVQLLAGVCAAASAYVAVVGHMVSTATFDLLGWLTVSWLVLRTLRTRDGRWWLAVGAAAGVTLLNKDLVLVLLVAVGVGVLALGPRAALRTWWLPAGVVVALLVASPNLLWQAAHGWPQLTVAAGISADDGMDNRMQFVPQQLVYLSPLLVPVWVAGLVRLWRDYSVRWARSFGLAYPVASAVVLVAGGKSYYVVPLLLVLLAAGIEPALCWFRRGRRRTRRALGVVGLTLAAVATAFIALPLLPSSLLGPSGVLAMNKETGEEVGWPRFTATVARGWREIPAGRRPTAVIVTANYGEAAAIALYGARLGLPQPYSGHMSFADWGPPPDTAPGPVLVVRQADDVIPPGRFTGCRTVARNDDGEGVDNQEQGALVSLCARPARPWSALWPELRRDY